MHTPSPLRGTPANLEGELMEKGKMRKEKWEFCS